MRVYFIRHAESTWNAFNDWSRDVPLTDNGINQAKHVFGYADVVICSSLKRAKQTLENSNVKYNEVFYSELCREIRQGALCDYMEGEDENKHETIEEINDRCQKLADLIKSHQGKIVAVVSHCAFINYMTGIFLQNCQVFEFEVK